MPRSPGGGRYARIFGRLLEEHPHPAGGRWSGPRMQEATGGFVNSAYFSNLLAGRIKQPGPDKLRAIAEAMGFPPRLWLEEPDDWGTRGYGETAGGDDPTRGANFKDLLNALFESLVDERTGEPLSEAEVSRRARGKVRVAEIRALRSGALDDPTLGQLLALSEAFGVDPAYWFGRDREAPLLDREVVEALKRKEGKLLLRASSRLSEGQMSMLLLLAEQLPKQGL